MEILTKAELRLRYDEIIEKIKAGVIFIHPTDTIYGISCSALNENSVQKIRELKERPDNSFSVWVPSLNWIESNCQLDKKGEEWLKELPGPYTLILKIKENNAVAKNVSMKTTLGVRLPDHWFSKVVKDLGIPIVTTSVNKAGQMFMTDKDNLDPEIEWGVSFLIYDGEKKGRPSKIVNLVEDKVVKR
ncbi:MAG: threonylcarbamoyl-AMP synthase [Nanoarchaeota archaeon]|nr:threonylcarbamoyl-AMP synthase [Nanoarchaeota archaeon]MBU1622401.1 threonylcarbamoyl-AMP synthase [Nanoarchaeota archaeon]